MARISFSALVEELVGKLAGSVFQDSYFGMQVRTRVSPRNPRSTYQQLRRGEFAFLSASWRNLTATQRQTFIDAAATPPQALNLFLQSNINLTLINESIIDTYVPSSDPGTMTIVFADATPSSLQIMATGSPQVVPAGTKLLLSITNQKPPTRIFTNPSEYSPVISFDEGTDLSTPTDILTEWQSRYGQLTPGKRLCLKSALIDKSNGLRGASVINCTIAEEMAKYIPIERITSQPSQTNSGAVTLTTLTIPANQLTTAGQRCDCRISGIGTKGAGTLQRTLNIAGHSFTGHSVSNSENWEYYVSMERLDNDDMGITIMDGSSFLGDVTEALALSGVDYTNAIDIRIDINTGTGSTQALIAAWLDFIDNP